MKMITRTLAAAVLLNASFAVAQSEYCIYQVDDYYGGPIGSSPYQMVEYAGELYFAGIDPSAGAELLKFDGSTISLVEDIRPGGLNSQPNFITEMNGVLYFAANDGTNGTELYVYNGSNASLVGNINPGAFHAYPSYLTVVNDVLYFAADDGSSGVELWSYDGITLSQVADINPGAASSNPTELFGIGTTLYFSADNGSQGVELHKWDGSALTSYDLNPGAGSSNPQFFYDWNGTLIFSADNGASGMELWETDGTTPTMTEIQPGGANGNPIDFVAFQGALYFRAATIANGSELYRYDGSAVGMVADILPGGFHGFPDNLTVFGNQLIFSANDGSSGYELYKWDGSSVSMVQNINPGGGDALSANNAEDFLIAGTKCYFLADDGTNGVEWWAYDGISCEITKDLNPGGGDCNGTEAMVMGDYVYFQAENGSDGPELHRISINAQLWDSTIVATCGSWTSPGGQFFTGNGTYQVTDVIPSVACPGCDSTIYTDLTITSDDLIINYSVINCGTWISPGGTPYSTPGVYAVSDTFNSVLCPGADSIINVDLEIVQLSNAVTAFSGVLVAQAPGANYQWLDCDDDYAFIPGENDQDFIPSVSGNYAVQVSLGGCVDTSACYYVEAGAFIEESGLGSSVYLYPNPTNGEVRIQTELEGDYLIRIFNLSGQLVQTIQATNSTTELSLAKLEDGMYLIEISNENGRAVERIVKR